MEVLKTAGEAQGLKYVLRGTLWTFMNDTHMNGRYYCIHATKLCTEVMKKKDFSVHSPFTVIAQQIWHNCYKIFGCCTLGQLYSSHMQVIN